MTARTISEVGLATHEETRAVSSTRRLVTRTLTYWRTRVGLAITALVLILVVVGPFVAPIDPNSLVASPGGPPGENHLLGADVLGRDVLSRFLSGGGLILLTGAMATLLGTLLGVVLGMYSGTGTRLLSPTFSWLTDVLLSFPQIVLPLLFIARFGSRLWLIVLVVALNQLPQTARLVKSITADVYQRDFIKVAEAVGLSRTAILFREVLPNLLAPIFVDVAFRFTYAIALVASLSFIGFGAAPPNADWGRMIYENRGFFVIQPWGVLAPMFAILALTLGTHLVADGLGRALGKDNKA